MKKPFRIQDTSVIIKDIEKGARRYPKTRKIFLLDGDALVLSNEKLIPILEKIITAFPKLTRIASYANGYNITSRSDKELQELYEHKLRLLYIGLESGNQEILDRCKKKSTSDEMVMAVQRAAHSNIKSSVILLLGLGGRKFSKEHIRDSIIVLNRMQPRYLSFLSLMLIPGTPLYREAERGDFEELNAHELLDETHAILEGLTLDKTIFRTNHASNYFPLEGRLPYDKERLLLLLKTAREGNIPLKPDFFRGL